MGWPGGAYVHTKKNAVTSQLSIFHVSNFVPEKYHHILKKARRGSHGEQKTHHQDVRGKLPRHCHHRIRFSSLHKDYRLLYPGVKHSVTHSAPKPVHAFLAERSLLRHHTSITEHQFRRNEKASHTNNEAKTGLKGD